MELKTQNSNVKTRERGFTLVEIVIVLGIFAFLVWVGTEFFIQVVRNSNRAAVEQELRQSASKTMLDMATEIRKAACVYYTAGGVGNPTATLRLSNSVGAADCSVGSSIVTYFQDTNGVVTKNNATITPGSVAFLDCGASSASCGSLTVCSPGLLASPAGQSTGAAPITITLKVQQKLGTTRSDFCAKMTLSSTVTPRLAP